MLKEQNIFSAIKPMLYSIKILGLTPFSLNGQRPNCRRRRFSNLAWSLSLMVVTTGISLYSVNTRPPQNNIIIDITDYLYSYFAIISMAIVITCNCIYSKRTMQILDDIAKLDKVLFEMRLPRNDKGPTYYEKFAFRLTTLTIVLWIYLIALTCLQMADFSYNAGIDQILASMGHLMAYQFPTFSVFALLQFCSLVATLRDRFHWLNCKIESFLGRALNHREITIVKISPWSLERSTKANYGSAKQIGHLHHKLCCVCEAVVDAFSIQILIVTTQIFITSIAVSFYISRYFFSSSLAKFTLIECVYGAGMIQLCAFSMIFLTTTCSSTVKQASRSGTLLQRVFKPVLISNKGQADFGVTLIVLQVMHQKLQFTACGLFTIDETLLFTLLGGATMYLIIVLQFDVGVKNEANGGAVDFNATSF